MHEKSAKRCSSNTTNLASILRRQRWCQLLLIEKYERYDLTYQNRDMITMSAFNTNSFFGMYSIVRRRMKERYTRTSKRILCCPTLQLLNCNGDSKEWRCEWDEKRDKYSHHLARSEFQAQLQMQNEQPGSFIVSHLVSISFQLWKWESEEHSRSILGIGLRNVILCSCSKQTTTAQVQWSHEQHVQNYLPDPPKASGNLHLWRGPSWRKEHGRTGHWDRPNSQDRVSSINALQSDPLSALPDRFQVIV